MNTTRIMMVAVMVACTGLASQTARAQQAEGRYSKEDTVAQTIARPDSSPAADPTAIRPFRATASEAELTDMRRRIRATRWPERETVADASQGVPLATMQKLARYWATEYDWRKVEAKLNALRNSSPRSTGWTFISFTFARSMRMRCRSSSRTDGPARSSSS